MKRRAAGKDFLGFPIPSAAGLVASLTLFIIKLNEKEKDLGHWGYLLPVVLVFLSAMMVSEVRYPELQIARPAFDHDVFEGDRRRAVRRVSS